MVCEWKCHRSTDKSYPGDNRLISPRVHIDGEVWHLDVGSSHPGAVFGPKRFGCSPIKVVRELGLERRETVWSLSAVGVGCLRGAAPSTRGPEWTHRWRIGCHANGTAEQLCADWINAESI